MTGIWRNRETGECMVASRLGWDIGTYLRQKLWDRKLLRYKDDENSTIVELFGKKYKFLGTPYLGLKDNKIYLIDSTTFYSNYDYICGEPTETVYHKLISNLLERLGNDIKDYFIVEVLK